jgi:hypothetical protein
MRQLVLVLRVWQPEVVVTDPRDGDGAAKLMAGAMAEAFRRAADANQFPEQIAKLGLSPWQAKKLYELGNGGLTDPVKLDTMSIRQRLGDTPREIAAVAGSLLAEPPPAAPALRGFRLVGSVMNGAATHAALMEGIDLGLGGTARRDVPPLDPATAEAFAELQKGLKLRRTLESLSTGAGGGLANADQLLSQIPGLLKSLPPEQGARAAFAIGNQFAKSGEWLLAREAFFIMVDRYPADPLSAEAYRWLIRYHASSEARRRLELGQFVQVTETTFAPTGSATSAQGASTAAGVEQVKYEQVAYLADRASARKWYEGSLEVQPRIAGFGPLFANDPAINFCLNASRRQLARVDDANKWYNHYLSVTSAPGAANDPWRDAAAAELWLSNRTGLPPKPIAQCRQAAMKPFLDGKLDDACWQSAQTMPLKPAPGGTADAKEYETKAWLTYDSEFVYFAVQCRHPADKSAAPASKRTRDADMTGYDRVSLMLDLDRDYQTYFRFQIDQRGCLAEDCWGDKKWNPRWFVAHKVTPEGWTAEVAIPMSELTGEGVTLGKTWAANVVRVLPGRGVLGWSLPADVEPRPEGMGLITFSQESK